MSHLARPVSSSALPTTMAQPKILWIDGVGSYAICDQTEATIGQAFPGNPVDLAIRGDLSRRAAVASGRGEGGHGCAASRGPHHADLLESGTEGITTRHTSESTIEPSQFRPGRPVNRRSSAASSVSRCGRLSRLSRSVARWNRAAMESGSRANCNSERRRRNHSTGTQPLGLAKQGEKPRSGYSSSRGRCGGIGSPRVDGNTKRASAFSTINGVGLVRGLLGSRPLEPERDIPCSTFRRRRHCPARRSGPSQSGFIARWTAGAAFALASRAVLHWAWNDPTRPRSGLLQSRLLRVYWRTSQGLVAFHRGRSMSRSESEALYRKALEQEDGERVSAGARVSHLYEAVQAGRAVYVDLSTIPEASRGIVVAEINEFVRRAAQRSQVVEPTSDATVI